MIRLCIDIEVELDRYDWRITQEFNMELRNENTDELIKAYSLEMLFGIFTHHKANYNFEEFLKKCC